MDFNTMTNNELVAAYNAAAKTPIKAWKGKKAVLIEKIQKLALANAGVVVMDNTTPAAEPTETVTKKAAKKPAKKVAAAKKPVVKIKAEGRDTIGGFTRELLQRVKGHVDKDGAKVAKGASGAQTVGMSYIDVLEAVVKRFPKCQTSYNCLRCYATRMREAGDFVPTHREKSRWK